MVLAEPEQVKGLEFDHVYLLGLDRGAIAGRDPGAAWIPAKLLAEPPDAAGAVRDELRRSPRPARRSPTWR